MANRNLKACLKATLLMGTLGAGLAACEVTPTEQAAIDTAFSEPPATTPPPAPEPACYQQHFVQPEAHVTRKIDLLFVTDTSESLSDERGAVADGIDAFVAALPSNVDYRIGVMTGHSAGSSWSGKLYRKGSNPYVLDSQTMDLPTIRSQLHDTLTMAMPGDHASDGGEEGMVSINRAMDDNRMALAKSLGFFRDDAALAVVFVSDENDICAVYPEGVTPVADPDGLEGTAHAHDCSRVAPPHEVDGVVVTPQHHEDITAELVVNKLRALKGGMPLVVGAVIYTDPSTVPHEGENEVGYGYKDMVELAGGVL
ncbi:MAG TPA: hypothetical protein VL588_09500, partial [Bdellovibrionota bacterium]|nr:hypothetical protein [Bdellovibrionota bacterium]